MPPVSEDRSSAISGSQKVCITSRDGGLCVLCGIDPVDVAYIVSQKSATRRQVDWIRQVAPSLSNFGKDDALNLICLCPTHHRQFVSGRFVLVPSRRQRELMLEHEKRNFATREENLAQRGVDPGRTFPQLVNEFEYIPVQGGPFRIHVHNPTPYDPSIFVVDNVDLRPCPLLHFHASHIALMVHAEPHLSSVTRLQSLRGDIAEPQIATLLRLYQRQPGKYRNSKPAISVPNNYEAFCDQLEQSNTQPSACILTVMPSLPLPAVHSTSLANDDPLPCLTVDSSSSASTNVSPQTEHADVNPYAGADLQLMEYTKERSITWEDLKTRPPLFGGEEQGLWRFASAEDVCRSRRLNG